MNFLPKGVDPQELLNHIREISWKVSDSLNSFSHDIESSSGFTNLEIKELKSGPVTNADLEANKIIISGIKSKYPNQNWLFLSEENVKEYKKEYFDSKEWVWIIDPLDGTRDFINKTGEYAVHISLAFKKKNILGVVIIPSREELWVSLENVGSWCELRNLKKISFNDKNNRKINELRVAISKTHSPKVLKNIIEKLNPLKIIGMGSIGHKITSIIKDEVDLYISYSERGKSSPKDWDIAAPEAIIRGFNGYFTDLNGNQLKFLDNNEYRQEGILIASRSNKHQKICNKIKELME